MEFAEDIKKNFLSSISAEGKELHDELFYTILLKDHKIAFQFIPLDQKKLSGIAPGYFADHISTYREQGLKLINIWEDIWWNKKPLVLSRINSFCGKTRRIHGRQTRLERIDKKAMDRFLNTHHLMGTAQAKYKYGLFYKDDLVAVASFSGGRSMTRSADPYRSFEMIRFANAMDTTVTGGLSKLLNGFILDADPEDIMTYVDREWSDGKSYYQLGFKLKEVTPPQAFLINEKEMVRYALNRLPEDFNEKNYFKIYNSGNLKLALRLR